MEPGQHHFEVQSSEVLLDAPIIAVRRDAVVMPGETVANREIVEHFGAVAIVAWDGERIALVRQYRHSVGRRLWELPAGLLDVSGEDALSCAQRELVEEAGLVAARWDFLLDVVSSPGFCDEAVRVFLARELSAADRPDAVGDEEADMVLSWKTPEEVKDLVGSGQITNSIAVSGLLYAVAVLEGRLPVRSPAEPFDLRPQRLAHRRGAGLPPGTDLKR